MALKKFEKKKNTTFPLILLTGFGKSLLFQALLQVRSTTHDVVSCKQHLEQDLSSIMAGNHYFHGQKTKSRSIGSDANYCNGCETSNVWRRNMSRSRESRPRGSRKQQTRIIFAARARTLNRFKKKLSWGTGIRSLSSFSLARWSDNAVRL